MALIPWRPFRELDTLRREMDRLWDRFFSERPLEWLGGQWTPSLDVSETKDKVVVKAEIPGIDPKDIDVSLSNGVLTIKGEKKQEREEKDENYHLVERSYGSFSRAVRLPAEVQEDKVKASYKDGVLKITLPKTERAKEKEIKIEVQ
ncbi:MAG: Hsp20/alpha crystallin family protein [Deltaproteobacteria bacterium]|nr:MAG: Hsp20/alpha crystallin family protein [Deltaproteobacteria bacterium]